MNGNLGGYILGVGIYKDVGCGGFMGSEVVVREREGGGIVIYFSFFCYEF